jgi:hypothetical protein
MGERRARFNGDASLPERDAEKEKAALRRPV